MGTDATAAAGPGATAASASDADILTYGRAKGVFAGVSLGGSTLRPDNEANRNLYGRQLSAGEIISGEGIETPPAANGLIATLQGASPQLIDDRHTSQVR